MKLRFSPVAFGVVYCVIYVVALAEEAALFLYHPQVRRFAWGWEPLQDSGPGMAWYGIMATAGLAGFVAAIVLPQQWLASRLHDRLWIFPVFALAGAVYLMRSFFFL